MEESSHRESFRTLVTIHWVITLVPLLIGCYMLYYNLIRDAGEIQESPEVLLYLPALFMIIAYPLSQFIFKKQIQEKLPDAADLQGKISVFQSAHLVRIAVIESVAIISAVVSYITGTNINLVILVVALLIMMMLAPSAYKIIEAMKLTPEERNQLHV